MEDNKSSEVQKLFDDLPTEDKREADIFGAEPVVQPATEKVEDVVAPEKDDEPRKNRRHRRLENQLAEEREARIRAEERVKALAEYGSKAPDTTVDDRLLRMYGPENAEAAKLHMELLNDFGKKAEERAIQRMQESQAEATRKQVEFEKFIDDELESIEDQFDVDVTSDSPAARKARKEFLSLVQKLSPKDTNGEIANYADFHEVWDIYQSRQEAPVQDASRAKEIAARTMQKPGSAAPLPPKTTPGFRGWQRDFNIQE